MRITDETLRLSSAAVVLSSLLALVLVAASAAIVAYVVLGTPAAAVDPTEGWEPGNMARTGSNTSSVGLMTAPDPPVIGVGGDPAGGTARPTIVVTAMAHDTPSPVTEPTTTPQVMVLPTGAGRTLRVAAAGPRGSERWDPFHLRPFSAFSADTTRVTPVSTTAAQAVPTATPSLPSTPPGALAVGSRVVITVPSARLRGAPSLESPVLAGLPQGSSLKVTGTPVEGSGYLWYPVEVRNEPGLAGYVAGDLIAPKLS
jgi:hypothetical protein